MMRRVCGCQLFLKFCSAPPQNHEQQPRLAHTPPSFPLFPSYSHLFRLIPFFFFSPPFVLPPIVPSRRHPWLPVTRDAK
jgi:hypothetical protein